MNLENKKILVTGGNGFLGRIVVEKLKKLNVKVLINPSSKELMLDLSSILESSDFSKESNIPNKF